MRAKEQASRLTLVYTKYENDAGENERHECKQKNKQRAFFQLHIQYERTHKKKRNKRIRAKEQASRLTLVHTKYENDAGENERHECERMYKQRAFRQLHIQYDRTRKKKRNKRMRAKEQASRLT
jgi:hypothetical protein